MAGAETTTLTGTELIAQMERLLVDRANDSYADALVIVARAHGGLDGVRSAEMTTIGCESFAITVRTENGTTDVTVLFEHPAVDLADLHTQTIGVVAAARARLGISEPTSIEIEAEELRSIPTHITTVVGTASVTPHIKQITFGGGDLANFRPAGPDQFLHLLGPPTGRTDLTIDAGFSWDQYDAMPEAERPIGAYYTVRRWRPSVDGSRPELDMWFVLHGDPDDPGVAARGHASAWAARAEPGDPVGLWGPRASWEPPPDTEWYLLAGDETGIPAIAAILESFPAGTVVRVFIEVSGPHDRVELAVSPTAAVTWVERGDEPAGTTPLLADAVRAMAWPAGVAYAWGGGESRSMTAIRKYVRREIGLPRRAVSMVAYWRHAADTTPLRDELES